MADVFHYWGSDLEPSETGDLRSVDGVERGQQRVLRRLLTNPREGSLPPDYVWHPEYGAGLRRRVGDTLDVPKLTSLIRAQIFLEEAVARTPEPTITVLPLMNGGMFVRIEYVDAPTRRPVTLSFNINR